MFGKKNKKNQNTKKYNTTGRIAGNTSYGNDGSRRLESIRKTYSYTGGGYGYSQNHTLAKQNTGKVNSKSSASAKKKTSSYNKSSSIYSGYSNMKNFGNSGTAPKNTKVRIRNGSRIITTNKGKAWRNRMAFPIFVFLFVLSFIYIVGSTYNFMTKKMVNYDVLSYGTIDTPKSAQGIIIRDEKVYNTDAAGVISYDVADGERVKKGTAVCSIKDETTVAQMQKTLDEINESIMKLQSEREDISIYSEDAAKNNKQIKEIIDNNAMDYAGMDIGNIYELKNDIQKQLDNRNQLLLSESKGVLGDLVAQKKAQEDKLNENISRITVDESGIVSYYIDGMENELTEETMLTLTKSQTTASSSLQNSFKTSVKSGTPAFKLVTSNIWYIAAYIDSEYVKNWEKDDPLTIYVKDNTGKKHKLDVTLQEISGDAKDKEKYIVLKVTKDLSDFINMRNITVETESTDPGYKIPNEAIAEETLLKIPADYIDENYNIYKVVNSAVTEVAVTVSGKDGESNMSYVPVQLGVINVGDTIKKPNSEDTFVISDVLNTKGIYVVNTGIAEFKTINLDNSISNNTHTILDPAKNVNIYVYDRILTDIRDVSKEDKVYE